MTTRARAQADAAASCVLYPQYTSMDAVLLDDGPDPPAAAAAPGAAAVADSPPPPKKAKAKRKAAAAVEEPAAAEAQPSTTAPATPAAASAPTPAADADATPTPDSDAGLSAVKARKKKKKGDKKATALPSGPGNADEAARIRSALGFERGQEAAEAAPAAAAPAPSAPASAFVFGFSGGGDGGAPAVVADGALDAAAAAAGVRSTAALPPPPPPPRLPSASTPAHPGLARRVFVGGMPFGYEEDDVRAYWEWCGPVAALDLMRFPDTGRFRGIAFITFATEDGYAKALECDGTMLDGVRVKVEPCKKGAAGGGVGGGGGPRRGHGGAGGGGAAAAPKVPGYNVAYVGNIVFEAGPDDVAALFAECGSGVSRVRLHTDRLTGASKGYAHVHFRDEAGLDAAVALDGTEFSGRPIRVGYAQPKAGAEPAQ